jgi:DNA-binding transcriptional LysR family regulator
MLALTSARACAQVRPYLEDVVQLVVGADHPLAGRREIDKGELAGLRFVAMHRSSTVQGIKAALEAAGIQWKTLQVVMVRARGGVPSSLPLSLDIMPVTCCAGGGRHPVEGAAGCLFALRGRSLLLPLGHAPITSRGIACMH